MTIYIYTHAVKHLLAVKAFYRTSARITIYKFNVTFLGMELKCCAITAFVLMIGAILFLLVNFIFKLTGTEWKELAPNFAENPAEMIFGKKLFQM